MSDTDKQLFNDFWYKFDETFHNHIDQDVAVAYQNLFFNFPEGFDHLGDKWTAHRRNGTFPAGFKDEIRDVSEWIQKLSKRQLEIIDRFFNGNLDKERSAFETFGQGILYDARRSTGQKLHKMDGDPPTPLIGYKRWHAFIRGAVLIGEDSTSTRWLQIDRNVGLAWEIQLQSKIQEDNPNNPGLQPDRINELRNVWLARTFDELDDAFDQGFST